MAFTESTWDLVITGDIVLGAKDGREWTVIGRDDREVHLAAEIDGKQKVHIIGIDRLGVKVVLVATAAQVAERAEALARITLGAEVIGRGTGEGQPFSTPDVFVDLASLYSHIWAFHQPVGRDAKEGAVYPTGTFADVAAAHLAMHAEQPPRPHIHDPHFYKEKR